MTSLVLVSSCNLAIGDHDFHIAGRSYVQAVRLAGALPLIAPPCAEDELPALLGAVHGVLLTGSPSNVHPAHFGEGVHDPALPLDPERDAWTLPLIRLVLARGMPLLAICRGAQETNVALGGSLHQAVQEQPGLSDHRADDDDPLHIQYGPVHPVEVVPGGRLARIVPAQRFSVNSLHGQGIKQMAAGLRVEAVAPDGLIEAFSVSAAPGFNLCLQWHPEWEAEGNPVSMHILSAFGEAVRQYRDAIRARAVA